MAQSKELKNLLRRVRRFNLNNPQMAINVENVKRIASPKGIAKYTKVVNNRQQIAKINTKIAEYNKEASEIREAYKDSGLELKIPKPKKLITKTPSERGQKAFKKLLDEMKTIKKDLRDYHDQREDVIRRTMKYNASLNGKYNDRLISAPYGFIDVFRQHQALIELEKGNIEEAKKKLGFNKKSDAKKSLRELTHKKEAFIKNQGSSRGIYTYADTVYFYNTIDHLPDSKISDFLPTMLKGGESLLLELTAAGFSMLEWYDPDESNLSDEDVTNNIRDQLKETLPYLSTRNQKLVYEYLKSVGEI